MDKNKELRQISNESIVQEIEGEEAQKPKKAKKIKEKAIVVAEPKQQEPSSVELFIIKAIENNLPVETMERLFALREKAKAKQAKEAFTEAMANFQAECPVIKKRKPVKDKNGKLRYKFAPIDDIIEQVKEPLGKNGLAYAFTEEKTEENLVVTCTITHRLGHSESSSFKVPIGKEEYMTDSQKHGARNTFAKRYAFCNALGIVTGDEDTDGDGEELAAKEEAQEKTTENKKMDYQVILESAGDMEQLQTAWAGIPGNYKPLLEKVKNEMKAKLSK